MFSQIPKPLAALAIIILAVIISLVLLNIDSPTYTQPYYFSEQKTPSPVISKPDTITPYIQTEVAVYKGKYSIYIKDLKRNKIYSHNPEEKISAASIYKLAVMYKAYDAIQKGELKKEDVLSGSRLTLDKSIASDEESIDKTSTETVSHSVDGALKLMITISDNYSALLLAEKLGWKNIDTFLESQNLKAFDLIEADSPTINVKVVGDLLEKIYNNQAVDKQSSQAMLKLLLDQTVNDRIPKYLPKDINIAHKTGELDQLRHDAGIVYGKNGDYIFVFLTETPTPLEASENIALLSKKIFDELEK